jgi:Concanavalin A-like lectin/glucanases superfamily/Kelch motif
MQQQRRSALSVITAVALTGCGSDGLTSPRADELETTLATDLVPVSWAVRKQIPEAVRAAAAASDGTRIYLFGGNAGFAQPTTGTRVYNPATNTWVTGASLPEPQDFAMAGAMSDGIHLVGGAGGPGLLKTHRVYLRGSNSWISRAPLLLSVDAAVARVVAGKLYIIGGGSESGPTGAIQVFNPATNSWSLKRPMPTPRLSAASAVIDGLIYVAGGQTAGIGTTAVLERYDPAANTWTTLAPLPAAAEALAGGNAGGRFCVAGGRISVANPTGNAFATSYCYAPGTNTWSRAPNMITPRVEAAAVELGGSLYVFGGRTKTLFATRTTERLDPSLPIQSLEFSQSFAQVPDNAAFDLSNTWTLEAWVYPTLAGNGVDQDIISKWGMTPHAAYIMQIDASGVLRLVTNDGSSNTIVLGRTAIANGAWHHLAASFANGTLKLYVDGVLDRTATGVLVPTNSDQPLAFGREGNFEGGTLQGRIDEIRIWRVARTGAQLATSKTKRLSGGEAGLRGYWRLDEGAGQTVYDATGLGHHGQLGTGSTADTWDPVWTTSGSPVH